MLRLRQVIWITTAAVAVGILLLVFLSFGWVGWSEMALAVAAGWIASWPIAALIAYLIRADDPAWTTARDRRAGGDFGRRAGPSGR